MQRLAVVASGWHFPAHFYRSIKAQAVPRGWKIDLFCVAHREPNQAHDKDLSKIGNGKRQDYDRTLYARIADESDFVGWNYKLYPNTMGDWGCSNQWLDDHDYRDYDMFLFTHDDNYIRRNDFIANAVETPGEWEILSNSMGMPKGWLRGSCEFFRKSLLDKIGGRFDLSRTTLTREGLTDNPEGLLALNDWNNTCVPLMDFIRANDVEIKYLSPYYRFSDYCLEGERGWIHYTHGQNTAEEEKAIETYGI